MIRAVIDTNVLISALIKPQGAVGPVLVCLRNNRFLPLYSDLLLDELFAKLTLPRIRDKYHLSDADIETTCALLLLRGEAIDPQHRIQACRDPRDDMLLEIAVEGRADYLVSGDQDLLVLHPFEEISIVKPAVFLKQLDVSGTGLSDQEQRQ